MRPVALAGVTGGIASWALQILRDTSWAVDSTPSFIESCPICESYLFAEIFGIRVHWTSLGIGVLVGLVLGPVIDCLYLIRQLWVLQLRSLAASWRPIRGGFRVVG